ncbi:hypothetical protein B0A48_15774 [Cryoendolithus antarcticus]|uniref:Uncharacterized protein n=1 Tax=Cryoendolithus antarcticus TaxID=1507870 RepID=A0A1V8SHE2_9PEZI|nr:hypothetical protein B0A48_15774 [Cryoendolithus antarcticus]
MAANTVAIDTMATESMINDTTTADTTPPAITSPNSQANLGALPQEIKDHIFDQLMLDPGLAPSRISYARAVDSSTRLRPLASWANFARVNRKFHASADRWLQDTHELVLVKIRWRKLVEYLDDCWTKEPEFINNTRQALAFEKSGKVAMTLELDTPYWGDGAPLVAFVAEAKYLERFYMIVRLVAGQTVTLRHEYASIAPEFRVRKSPMHSLGWAPSLRFAVRLAHMPRKLMTVQRQKELLRPLQSIIADGMDFTIEGDVCDRSHADAVTLMMYGGFPDISDSSSMPVARLWDYISLLSRCKDMVDEDIANGREQAALTWLNRIAGPGFVKSISELSTLWRGQSPALDVLAALYLLQHDMCRTCTWLHLRLSLPESRQRDPAMFNWRGERPAVDSLGAGWVALMRSHPHLANESNMQTHHMRVLYRDFNRPGLVVRRGKTGESARRVQQGLRVNSPAQFDQWALMNPHADLDLNYIRSETLWPVMQKSSVFKLGPMSFNLHKDVVSERGQYHRWWDVEMLRKHGWELGAIGEGIEYPVKITESLQPVEVVPKPDEARNSEDSAPAHSSYAWVEVREPVNAQR